MLIEEWERILNENFDPHVDIHGNIIFPIKSRAQWLLYNHYCFLMVKEEEEIERDSLAKEEIEDLCEFWKFSKKQTKEDNVFLCIFKEKKEYKVVAYYRDKIKEIGGVKGDAVE
jgi:hypothetical protein